MIAVYRKLLPSPNPSKLSLFVSTTRTVRMCGNFTVGWRASSTYREAVSDFRRVNLRVHDLRPFLGAENISFITEREVDSFFGGSLLTGWERFHSAYPNADGYYAFSAIGFDKKRTLAAVYMEGICGVLCGSGEVLFLKRGLDGWSLVKPPFRTCRWDA